MNGKGVKEFERSGFGVRSNGNVIVNGDVNVNGNVERRDRLVSARWR